MKPLTEKQIGALKAIHRDGGIEMGDGIPLGTIKALERRGLVETHSSGRWPGSLGHFLSDDGRKLVVSKFALLKPAKRKAR